MEVEVEVEVDVEVEVEVDVDVEVEVDVLETGQSSTVYERHHTSWPGHTTPSLHADPSWVQIQDASDPKRDR